MFVDKVALKRIDGAARQTEHLVWDVLEGFSGPQGEQPKNRSCCYCLLCVWGLEHNEASSSNIIHRVWSAD